MEYDNPWYNKNNTDSRPHFDTGDRKIMDYQGYQIVKWHDSEYHVLKNGHLRTMVAGPNGAMAWINGPKYNIGAIGVVPKGTTNPYTYHAEFSMGKTRAKALKDFREGKLSPELEVWVMPAEGGAYIINANEVYWEE